MKKRSKVFQIWILSVVIICIGIMGVIIWHSIGPSKQNKAEINRYFASRMQTSYYNKAPFYFFEARLLRIKNKKLRSFILRPLMLLSQSKEQETPFGKVINNSGCVTHLTGRVSFIGMRAAIIQFPIIRKAARWSVDKLAASALF